MLFTVLINVGVQSFPLRAIGQQAVRSMTVDQSNVADETDLDFERSEVLERARLSDVFKVFVAYAGDTRCLHDEIFSKELGEALGIVGLVRISQG